VIAGNGKNKTYHGVTETQRKHAGFAQSGRIRCKGRKARSFFRKIVLQKERPGRGLQRIKAFWQGFRA
jgi:hypothetical protein